MFSASFLFTSLIWVSIGVGYFIYGKEQQSFSAMGGGILLVAVSDFVGSALLMSVICILIILAVYGLVRRGYWENQCDASPICFRLSLYRALSDRVRDNSPSPRSK
jgi:hypothetical protein